MSSPTGGSSSAPAQPANPSAPTSNSPDARPEADAGGSDGLIKHERFSPEEEATLLEESNSHKTEANMLFASGKYDMALTKYEQAVAVCPNYLDYELAVLRSNMAACHLKLEEWKEAVNSATAALDGLDRLEREEKEAEEKIKSEQANTAGSEAEMISLGAANAGPALSPTSPDSSAAARLKRQDDILRIRAKALMRRARARSELGGWANLEGAIEDYKRLEQMDKTLGATDRRIVQAQLRALPPRAKAAQEKETAEMWSKLKDLGNGLLRPFGLSTDNFKMVKDEKTGGYSLSFQGGRGS